MKLIPLILSLALLPIPALSEDAMMTPDQAFLLPLENGSMALFTATSDGSGLELRRVLTPGRTTEDEVPDLRPGDKVLSVNETSAPTVKEMRRLVEEIAEGEPVRIGLQREGETFEITMPRRSIEPGFH